MLIRNFMTAVIFVFMSVNVLAGVPPSLGFNNFALAYYKPDESLIRKFDQEFYDKHEFQPFPKVILFQDKEKKLIFIASKHKNWIKTQEVITEVFQKWSPQVVLIEGIQRSWGLSPQNWEQQAREDLHHNGSESYFTYNKVRALHIPFIGSELGQMKEFSSYERDILVVRLIADLMNQYQLVVVVYGAGHYVQQEATLKKMFGSPSLWK